MKISIKLFLLFPLFSMLILIACKDNTVNPNTDTSFYPISVGNTWKYNFKDYDSTGILVYEGTFDEKFISARIKDGQLVYQFDSPLNPPSPDCCDYKYYYQNKADGVHRLIASDSTGYWVSDYLLYKYPCMKNDIFTNGSNNYDTTYVILLNDTVICDAGTFECIVYKNVIRDLEDSSLTKLLGYTYSYVSKGVGKIKFKFYRSDSSGEIYKDYEYSLINYTLK